MMIRRDALNEFVVVEGMLSFDIRRVDGTWVGFVPTPDWNDTSTVMSRTFVEVRGCGPAF